MGGRQKTLGAHPCLGDPRAREGPGSPAAWACPLGLACQALAFLHERVRQSI